MSVFDAVRSFFTLEPQQPLRTRTELATGFDEWPDLSTQIANIRRFSSPGPYRQATVQQALGVPAIFGAVNLIANLTGSMSMKAMRNEVELAPAERPRLIVRPDPFTIPREFFRSTAYNLASRGEAWWWAAVRDGDGQAVSLLNIPPNEVTVDEDPKDLRYPIIKWRGKVMRNEDFRQLVYSREPGALRGIGPLQMCGAAISVAVESQLWAANFFAGGNSAIWVKVNTSLSGDPTDPDGVDGTAEVQRFLDQWMAKDANTPRITDDTVEDIKELNLNPQGAQMLEARSYQNSEVAVMFNIPGTILDVAISGQSLTYQNVGSEFENLLRRCLRPNYLEVMEQTMTDFLTRSTVARFNTEFLTLADVKTRYEVYGLGIEKGIIDAEEARRFEGLAPGDVENAPVPLAPPQAIPSALQMRSEVRCEAMVTKRRSGVTRMTTCGKLLSTDGTRPSYCPRCKSSQAAA